MRHHSISHDPIYMSCHDVVVCGQVLCGVLICDCSCQGKCSSCILDRGSSEEDPEGSRGMCFMGRMIKCLADATGGDKNSRIPTVSVPSIEEC